MRTILVVDDELGVAEVLEAVLVDEGYGVVTATNGRQGLLRLAEMRPDAVLLDFMMPGMDGCAMLRAMQADPALADIPVVMMSAVPEAAIQSEVTGYAGFMRKPFRIKIVLQMLDRILGGEKSL